jgi:hypothetical protein
MTLPTTERGFFTRIINICVKFIRSDEQFELAIDMGG